MAQETSSKDDFRPLSEESAESVTEKASGSHEEPDSEAAHEAQQQVFKQMMRTVPHPIAIVTTQSPTAQDDQDAVMGATVSSFNTVSFSPDLVVSFNLTADSATYRTILDSNHFCVNFPVNNHAGSLLADRFTQGNHPPPLSRDLQPPAQAMYWKHTPASTSTKIKQYPPAVFLKNRSLPTGDAGFAFAFLCEYQTSLPVGDKVIVTGRLIPHRIRSCKTYGWGFVPPHSINYTESHTTMAYAHGHYGTTDNGRGIDSMWKLEDPYTDEAIATADKEQIEIILGKYKRRLDTILHGRMLQQRGRLPPSRSTPSRQELRASELPATRLDEFEALYTDRLALAEVRNARLNPPGQDKAPSAIPAWQHSMIRKKMLLNDEELAKEEVLFAGRLRRLQEQRQALEKKSQLSTMPQNDEDQGEPSAPTTERARMNEMATHLQERLDVIRETQRRKKDGTPSIEIKKMNKQQITRFLESKRTLGYDALKRNYRKDLYQIQEARVSLLELENRPGAKDQEAIKNLKERINYFSETSELIAKLIVERVTQADPMELNSMIKRPLHGMEGPPPKPEVRTAKKKGKGAGVRIIKIGSDRQMAHALEEAHATQVAARHTSAEDGRPSEGKDEEGQDFLVMKHHDSEEIPTWPNEGKR